MAGNDVKSTSCSPTEGEDSVVVNVDETNDFEEDSALNKPPFKWPSLHLLSGKNRAKCFSICVRLHKAALKGDVKELYKFSLGMDFRSVLRAAITNGYETMLHVAAGARQMRFVKEIVNLMAPEDLALQDKKGNTALSVAAATGNLQIAKIMLEKNPSLLTIRGSGQRPPLYVAALFGKSEMASFLYTETKQHLTEEDRKAIFFMGIDTGLYDSYGQIKEVRMNCTDLALALLEDDKELALAHQMEFGGTALHMLAQHTSAFVSRTPRLFKRLTNLFPGRKFAHKTQALDLVKLLWKEIINRDDVDTEELVRKPSNLLLDAATSGNVEFLAELIHSYPDLVHELDENGRSIFHIAALHHDTNMVNLIHETGLAKDLLTAYVDKDQNNMLHLAAKYEHRSSVSTASGAALEMHREVRMFKEVEMLVKPFYKEMKNSEGRTPRELFTMEHSELLKRGEHWIKNTSSSCAVVATLIAVLMLTAAFIAPATGSSNDETGISITLRDNLFQAFAVADAVSLSCSSVSMLIFLSILTSHCSENDFLWSLPFKLMVGLSALFTSIMGMMIAFCSIFVISFHRRLNCVPLLTLVLTPVAASLLIVASKFHFSKDIFHPFWFRVPPRDGRGRTSRTLAQCRAWSCFVPDHGRQACGPTCKK